MNQYHKVTNTEIIICTIVFSVLLAEELKLTLNDYCRYQRQFCVNMFIKINSYLPVDCCNTGKKDKRSPFPQTSKLTVLMWCEQESHCNTKNCVSTPPLPWFSDIPIDGAKCNAPSYLGGFTLDIPPNCCLFFVNDQLGQQAAEILLLRKMETCCTALFAGQQ